MKRTSVFAMGSDAVEEEEEEPGFFSTMWNGVFGGPDDDDERLKYGYGSSSEDEGSDFDEDDEDGDLSLDDEADDAPAPEPERPAGIQNSVFRKAVTTARRLSSATASTQPAGNKALSRRRKKDVELQEVRNPVAAAAAGAGAGATPGDDPNRQSTDSLAAVDLSKVRLTERFRKEHEIEGEGKGGKGGKAQTARARKKARQRHKVLVSIGLAVAMLAGISVISVVISSTGIETAEAQILESATMLNENNVARISATLAKPIRALAELDQAFDSGALLDLTADTTDTEQWDPYMIGQLDIFDSHYLYFGFQQNGTFYGGGFGNDTVYGIVGFSDESTDFCYTVRIASEIAGGYRTDVDYQPPNCAYDPRARPWYIAAVDAGAPRWTDVYWSQANQEWIISVAAPFWEQSDLDAVDDDEVAAALPPSGVVAADISTGTFSDELLDILEDAGVPSGSIMSVVLDGSELGGIVATTEAHLLDSSEQPYASQLGGTMGLAVDILKRDFGGLDVESLPSSHGYLSDDVVFTMQIIELEDSDLRWVSVLSAEPSFWLDFVDDSTRDSVIGVLCVMALSFALGYLTQSQAKASRLPAYMRAEHESDEEEVNWNVVFVVVVTLLTFSVVFVLWNSAARAEIDDLVTDRVKNIYRVVSTSVVAFLKLPHQTNMIVDNMLNTGWIGFGDNVDRDGDYLDRFFCGELDVFPELYMSYVGSADGNFVGAKNYLGSRAITVLDDSTSGLLFNYYVESDDNVRNTSNVAYFSRGYDPRIRPWYIAAEQSAPEASWTSPYTFSDGSVGISAVLKLPNATDSETADQTSLESVVAADYYLSTISDYLSTVDLGGDTTGTIFIVEREYSLVVAGEVQDGALIATTSGSEISPTGDRVLARNSGDELIVLVDNELRKRFGEWATMEPWVGSIARGTSIGELLVIVDDLTDEYGLDWIVVVAFERTTFYEEIDERGDQAVLIGGGVLTLLLFIAVTFTDGAEHDARIADAASMTALARDERERVKEVMGAFRRYDQLNVANLLVYMAKKETRDNFIGALAKLELSELHAFVRVTYRMHTRDRVSFSKTVRGLTEDDMFHFLHTIPGVSEERESMFFERAVHELRALVLFSLHINQMDEPDKLHDLTKSMHKGDVENLLVGMNVMSRQEKNLFVENLAVASDESRAQRCDKAAQRAREERLLPPPENVDKALQFVLSTRSGRKIENILYYEVFGVHQRFWKAVYYTVSGRTYELAISFVTVCHCLLTFWEAPGSHGLYLYGGYSDSFRWTLMDIELVILLLLAIDFPIQMRARGLFRHRIVHGRWKRSGVRLAMLTTGILTFVMWCDWIYRASLGNSFTSGTEYVPVLIPYTAVLRPGIFVMRHQHLIRAVKSFMQTLVFAKDVFIFFFLLLAVGAIMGVLLFSESTLYDPQNEPFANFLIAWRQMFVFMTTAENYPDLAFPPADRANGGAWFYSLYFFFFAVLGNLIALSLIVAIFEDKYTHLAAQEQLKQRRNVQRGMVAAFVLLDTGSNNALGAEEYEGFCKTRMNVEFTEPAQLTPPQFVELCEQLIHRLELSAKDGAVVFEAAGRARSLSFTSRMALKNRLNAMLTSRNHDRLMLFTSMAFLWSLTLYGTFSDTAGMDSICILTLLVYAVELGLRIVAVGWVQYWHVPSNVYAQLKNRYDCYVTVITFFSFLVAYIADDSWTPGEFGTATHVTLALPILRIFSTVAAIRSLFFGLLAILPTFRHVVSLVLVTMYVYAVIGVLLFAGEFWFFDDDVYDMPQANFGSFVDAATTLSLLVIGEGWNGVMDAAITAYGISACIYFISWVIIVVVLLTTLFVSIILVAFATIEHLRKTKANERVTAPEMDAALEGGDRDYRYFQIKLPAEPDQVVHVTPPQSE